MNALNRYASEVRVPALDISSSPFPLDDVFVEPQLQSEYRAQLAPDKPQKTRESVRSTSRPERQDGEKSTPDGKAETEKADQKEEGKR